MKNRYVLLADLPLIVIAAFGAFAGRFDWLFYGERPEFVPYVLAALVVKPVIFTMLGMYQRYWSYASVPEMVVVVIAVTASSVAMALFAMGATQLGLLEFGFSRVVVVSDWVLTLVLTGGLRLAIRVVHESLHVPARVPGQATAKRALIVGAGAAGTLVAREMRRNPQIGMEPAGFLDDDPDKIGKQISGLRVMGDLKSLPDVIRTSQIDLVVIAMPLAPGPTVRAVHEMCNNVGVKSQTIPGMFELLDGHVSVSRLRGVEIEDLLRRSPIDSRQNAAQSVTGQVVLITGAGGSIGFELARQIARVAPSHLVLLGHGENSIFEAEARLKVAFPHVRLSTVITDIRDEGRLASVFETIKPAIVFHAAAHKHVPLMEENPEEAVTNNVIGTRNVVRQAIRVGTDRFVLISTDKAVSPTSIMGATKRLAEAIVRQAGETTGRPFVVVRFGNVLGSRGSVVNTFKAQIERGGPVTVTHPNMTRYFMTIPEAVHLVLHAGGLGKGGDLFVLDMGEPVRIVDLARDLIKLSGFEEGEIPIVFTGMRRGEKMEEALFHDRMVTRPTSHPDVLEVVGDDDIDFTQLDAVGDRLAAAAHSGDRPRIYGLLGSVIPDFRHPASIDPVPTRESTHSD